MQQFVTVLDLNSLADTRADDSRPVNASTLIDHDGLGWNWSLRKVSFQMNENVSEIALCCRDDEFLNNALAGIHLRALRIHAHADDGISG